eukprot:1190503-Prorocentrum_minimum.AAC.3
MVSPPLDPQFKSRRCSLGAVNVEGGGYALLRSPFQAGRSGGETQSHPPRTRTKRRHVSCHLLGSSKGHVVDPVVFMARPVAPEAWTTSPTDYGLRPTASRETIGTSSS